MALDILEIGGVPVYPGEDKIIKLPLARLYDFTEISIPIRVIRGILAGPILFVSAAIHGDEINGVEIIRKVSKHPRIKEIRGTLILIPTVNVFGFNNKSRYLPDRRDLNRSFPGSEKGSLASRIAYIFMNEVVKKCTHGIDLHTGAINRTNLPQIRADLNDLGTKKLAQAFGAPLMLNSQLRDGSLRESAKDLGIPMLLFEGGEALRFDEATIKVGVGGILSVMEKIGMLTKRKRVEKKKTVFLAESSHWLRAPQSGMMYLKKGLGKSVYAGDVLGYISDIFGNNRIPIICQFDGVIIGKHQIPLVNKGDALLHIACFNDMVAIEEQFEEIGLLDMDLG